MRAGIFAPWALAALTAAGCFERGRAPRVGDDAGAAVVVRDAAARPELAHREPVGAADPAATIAIALEAEPPTLDPLIGADAITGRVTMGDVYQGLVCAGARLGDPLEPCLADRWTASSDGRVWTFHLREARWHDGAAVTADDVAFTVEAVRAQGSWLIGELDDLERVEVPAPDTVVLRFAAARPDRLARLARLPILPRHAFAGVDLGRAGALAEAPASRAPIGSGPLRVVAWKPGDRIELARWDGHWGPPAAAAKVVYRIAADRAHALRMLDAGEVDVVVQVPVDEATRFAGDHDAVGSFGYRLPGYLAAIYNGRRAALATPEQRRALTALLDRDGVATRLLASHPITGPFPDGDPGVDPTVIAVPFDRALATRLLGGARPRIELLVPAGSTTMARVADIWAADARGIADLVVVSVPFADLLARLASGDFDVALTSMSTGPELDLSSRLSSKAPPEEAWCGLADPELDRLLDEVLTEPDDARRAERRRALHRRIAELAPMAFIAADVRLGLARRDIGGVAGAPEGGPPRAARLWRAR